MVRRETYGDICHRIDMKQWRLAELSYGRTGAVIVTSFMRRLYGASLSAQPFSNLCLFLIRAILCCNNKVIFITVQKHNIYSQ